uniref:AAA+ ATPase domain-containing protein n=1 Tax=viral metagenome TaxID=1070528 RepID=A0A6C0ARC1_9ZZZZ
MSSSGVPLVELYRPKNFEDIVLDPLNKQILKNIIDTSYFPNLLFYGPPGTGKTTTIINLINAYQEKLNIKNKDLIIHLNASDERGIDIIRNQINFFVNSNPLFHTGMKFVILDEVDYMTKNAQQALRYLLQNYSSSVRFCLICNYISKIDEGLQNEFIRLRFNQLPKEEIIKFLKNISISENLNLSEKSLECIQKLYKSDIRSMINFMQSNQDIVKQNVDNDFKFNIIDNNIWENLISMFLKREKINTLNDYIYLISIKYNIDKKNIIKDFLNYIIRNYSKYVNTKFLEFVENLLHSQVQNNNVYVNYSLTRLSSFISS